MGQIVTFADLDERDKLLVDRALDASGRSYAPYSGFAVGAAIRTAGGQLFTGANLENASYGLSICAEMAALAVANSAGDLNLEAVAVVGLKFTNPADTSQ